MTVRAWRLVKTRHARRAFTGEGAREFGGRWTSKGVAAVYTSATQSLALLEVLVHLGAAAPLGAYSLIPADFDEKLVWRPRAGELPAGWRAMPAPAAVRAFGDAWVQGGRSAVLAVPSAVVPAETNYVLNPAHPRFGEIRIGKAEAFEVDVRLGVERR